MFLFLMGYTFKKFIGLVLLWACFWAKGQTQDWAPVRAGEIYHYLPDSFYYFYNTEFPNLPNTPIFRRQYLVNYNFTGTPTIETMNGVTIQLDTLTDHMGNRWYTPKPIIQVCDTCRQMLARLEPVDFYPIVVDLLGGGYRIIYQGDTIEIAEHPLQTAFHDTVQHLQAYPAPTVLSPLYAPALDSFIDIHVVRDTAPQDILYQFTISKNHGFFVLRGPTATLMFLGKEGLNPFGYQSPQFDDIFDFDVGDQFFYEDDYFRAMGVCNYSYLYNTAEYRLQILQRQDIGTDSIVYTIERIDYQSRCPNLPIIDTFVQVYTSDPTAPYNAREGYWQPARGHLKYFTAKEFFTNSNLKYVGYDLGLDTLNRDFTVFVRNGNNATDYYPDPPWGRFQLYRNGLGAIYDERSDFERFSRKKLLGYIKGTDTIGRTPSILTGVQTLKSEQTTIELFPNPAHRVLYCSPAISGVVTFYNHLGQIVQQQQVDNALELDVQELPEGLYWLFWKNDKAILRKQLRIAR